MKKSIFILLVVASLFAGCSKAEVVETYNGADGSCVVVSESSLKNTIVIDSKTSVTLDFSLEQEESVPEIAGGVFLQPIDVTGYTFYKVTLGDIVPIIAGDSEDKTMKEDLLVKMATSDYGKYTHALIKTDESGFSLAYVKNSGFTYVAKPFKSYTK